MKVQWCWRCKIEVPMLDDEESKLCFSFDVAASAEECRISPETAKLAWHNKVLARYQALTGFPETNFNAVYHHCLSYYGDPCPACGKPFRTPRASFCAACGFRPGVR